MPTAPDNHDAHDAHDTHDDTERIRERLPRRLQELRERCGVGKYGLARENGISRGYIGKIERQVAGPFSQVSDGRPVGLVPGAVAK